MIMLFLQIFTFVALVINFCKGSDFHVLTDFGNDEVIMEGDHYKFSCENHTGVTVSKKEKVTIWFQFFDLYVTIDRPYPNGIRKYNDHSFTFRKIQKKNAGYYGCSTKNKNITINKLVVVEKHKSNVTKYITNNSTIIMGVITVYGYKIPSLRFKFIFTSFKNKQRLLYPENLIIDVSSVETIYVIRMRLSSSLQNYRSVTVNPYKSTTGTNIGHSLLWTSISYLPTFDIENTYIGTFVKNNDIIEKKFKLINKMLIQIKDIAGYKVHSSIGLKLKYREYNGEIMI